MFHRIAAIILVIIMSAAASAQQSLPPPTPLYPGAPPRSIEPEPLPPLPAAPTAPPVMSSTPPATLPPPPALAPPPAASAPVAAGPATQRVFCDQPVTVRVADRDGIPEPYRQFLGIWSDAAWTPQLCAALVVESVQPDGTASIVYAFGPMGSNTVAPAAFCMASGSFSTASCASRIPMAANLRSGRSMPISTAGSPRRKARITKPSSRRPCKCSGSVQDCPGPRGSDPLGDCPRFSCSALRCARWPRL